LIQTSLSYKLNPTIEKTLVEANGILAEVVQMSVKHSAIEALSARSGIENERKISQRKQKLDDVMLNAVDETLKQVFKEEGTCVIHNYLENQLHLRREEIVEKPDVFSTGLKRLLVSAAPVIEKKILENLYSKLGLKFEDNDGYEFPDYIRELKIRCGC
jgi:hypothetical protein